MVAASYVETTKGLTNATRTARKWQKQITYVKTTSFSKRTLFLLGILFLRGTGSVSFFSRSVCVYFRSYQRRFVGCCSVCGFQTFAAVLAVPS